MLYLFCLYKHTYCPRLPTYHVKVRSILLCKVHTPRISARLIWAIAEHFDMEGLDPLLADDPEDPLNIFISNIHNVLFNTDSSATTSNKLQDVQAVLICAQRLGSRNPRAGQLLSKELEDFKGGSMADSVNKHQSRFILQMLKFVTSHPESRSVLCARYKFSKCVFHQLIEFIIVWNYLIRFAF